MTQSFSVRILLFLRWPLFVVAVALATLLAAEAAFRVSGVRPAAGFPTANLPDDIQPVARPSFEVDRRGYWAALPHVPGVGDEGFRLASAKPETQGGPVLIVLGSDLAWGGQDPVDSAAALLGEAGYTVHNLATPKAPHTQWPLLMSTYGQRLQPEMVLVVLDIGQDLARPIPVTPQHPPYFETNAGFVRAIDGGGNRLTFSQAVRHHREMIESHRFMRALARYSALAYGMLERNTYAGMADWDIAAAVESIELARLFAEDNDAAFALVLAEVPGNRPFAAEQNARAAAALATFEPVIFPAPAGGETAPTGRVQSALAARLGSVLGDAGLPAPRPGVLEMLEASASGMVPWRLWERRLGLSAEQSAESREALNRFKDAAAALFTTPPEGGGETPVAVLARQAAGDGTADFGAYTAQTVVAGRDSTYAEALEQLERETMRQLMDTMEPSQIGELDRMDTSSLLEIDTGYDPVGDAVNQKLIASELGMALGDEAAGGTQAKLAFDAFAEHTGLRADQRDEVEAVLNELKDAFMAVLTRPSQGAGVSPLAHVAARLKDEGAEAEAALGAFMANNLDGETGEPYTNSLMAAELAAREALRGLLEEDQIARLSTVPVEALMHVDTGYDPAGAWLEEQYRAAVEASAADAEMARWNRLSARLELDEEQSLALKQRVNLLKEEIAVLLFTPPDDGRPAPGAYLAERQQAEDENAIAAFAEYADSAMVPGTGMTYNARMKLMDEEARAALAEVLTSAQLEALDRLPYTLLSDIPTGYDPFGSRLQALYGNA